MSNVIEISYVVFLLNSGLSPNQGHFFTLYEGLPVILHFTVANVRMRRNVYYMAKMCCFRSNC
jgi:hypothetical protein